MKITKDDVNVVEGTEHAAYAYALGCVRVEPGRLVATEGHVLIIREVEMEEEEESFEPFLLEGKAMREACRAGGLLHAGNEERAVFLHTNSKGIQTGEASAIPKAGGQYPDYQRVMPRERREGEVCVKLDPQLLMRVLKGMQGCERIHVCMAGTDSAIRFEGRTEELRNVTALLMPIRSK